MKFMNIIYTFLLSLILWKFFPKALRSSFEQLHKGKIRSLLYGLMTLIILPLLAVILLVSVVGIPFALTLAALNLLTFYSSKSIVILWCAKNWASYLRYYSSTKQVALIAVSTLIYFFITSLPFIGSLVAFSFLLLGLGAVVLSTIAREKKFIFF